MSLKFTGELCVFQQKSKLRFNQEKGRFNRDKYNFNGINQDLSEILSWVALALNDLYDTTCMIQLVWLCKIANSYKLDVQIFVWYSFWKIGWVLFLPTCMKERNKPHLKFRNAKIYFIEWSLNQVICFLISFCGK